MKQNDKPQKPQANKLPEGYFEIFSQAFRRIWRNPQIWFWGLLIPSGFAYQFGGGDSPEGSAGDYSPEDMLAAAGNFISENLVWIIMGILIILAVSLFLWILSSIARAGLIKKIDKMQNVSGEKGQFKEIWELGRLRFVNILKIDLIVFAITLLLGGGIALMIFGVFQNPNPGLISISVVFGVAVFIGLLLLLAAKSIAVIFTVFVDLNSIDSIKKGFGAIFANKLEFIKLLFLILLINIITGIALAIAVFMILLIVGAPLALLAKIANFSNIAIMMVAAGISGLFMILLALFLKAFTALWKLDVWIWWVKKVSAEKTKEDSKESSLDPVLETMASKKPEVAMEKRGD